MGDARPVKSLPLPLLLLLPFPTLAAGAGLSSTAGAGGRARDDEPADIAAPIPKISRGFFALSEPARLEVRDAVPARVPAPLFRFATRSKYFASTSAVEPRRSVARWGGRNTPSFCSLVRENQYYARHPIYPWRPTRCQVVYKGAHRRQRERSRYTE